MNKKINPFKPFGKVIAPPSKSVAHRMIICAALANGESVIKGISASEDILATLDCARALGAKCILEGDTLTISRANQNNEYVFPCRESGSTLRFFIPIALALFSNATFTGTKRLMERGVGIYEELFEKIGIIIEKDETSIKFCGKLTGGNYSINGNVSSQFITGLLLALALLEDDSTVNVIPPVESKSYINITLGVMRSFGVEVAEISENRYYVKGGQKYKPQKAKVEGDWSNGSVFYGFNEIGGNIDIEGLCKDSLQGDKACIQCFDKIDKAQTVDISDCPDLAPVLFAVAAIKGGGNFVGTRRLKIKESDRAEAMKQELAKFGVNVEIFENSVSIGPNEIRKPTLRLCSHNDHRIVMALTVLASMSGGIIENAQVVSKSYPDFFERITELGGDIEDVT